MKITYGIYKDQDFDDIPVDYLQWLEEQTRISDAVRTECQFQLQRRMGDRPGMGKVVKPGRY